MRFLRVPDFIHKLAKFSGMNFSVKVGTVKFATRKAKLSKLGPDNTDCYNYPFPPRKKESPINQLIFPDDEKSVDNEII